MPKKLRRLRNKIILVFVILCLNVAIEFGRKSILEFCESTLSINSTFVYLLLSLVFLIVTVGLCYKIIFRGLVALCHFKKNDNIPITIASFVAFLHLILCLIFQGTYVDKLLHSYSLLIVSSFFFILMGDYVCEKRVQENIKFISNLGIKKCVCLVEDKFVVRKLLNSFDESQISYTRKANSFESLKKFCYCKDPSSIIISNFSWISFFICLLTGIIEFIVKKDFMCSWSAMTLVACMCVPMSLKLVANVSLKKVSRDCMKENALISGFQTIKKFGNVTSVFINDADLYPRRKVLLQGVKTFSGKQLDEALVSASAVVSEVNGLLKYTFSKIIKSRKSYVKATNVMYEDNKGLVGWVNKKRILVGNRDLLKKYGVVPPSYDSERRYLVNNKRVTYIAVDDKLVVMLLLTYRPNQEILKELKILKKLGVKILVRTSDNNVTPELIANDFNFYYDAIKTICHTDSEEFEKMVSTDIEKAEPYAVTFGSAISFIKIISSCIRAKSAIALGIMIEALSIILGVVLVLMLVLYATVDQIGIFELFLYSLLWTSCSCIVPRVLLRNRKDR